MAKIVSNTKVENSEQDGKNQHELVFEVEQGKNTVQFSQSVLLTDGKEDAEAKDYVDAYEKEWLEANPAPKE